MFANPASLRPLRTVVVVILTAALACFTSAFASASSPHMEATSAETATTSSDPGSCPANPNLISASNLRRSELDAVANQLDSLFAQTSTPFNGTPSYQIAGGSSQTYTDGHTVVTALIHIDDTPAVLSLLTPRGESTPTHVSLAEATDPADPDAVPHDLLADSDLPSAEQPAYYAKTCAGYSGSCLKSLLSSGCSAGACAFLYWNNYLLGSCLAGYCFYGTQKCCTKWVDAWHQY